jgi:hypothetical protein
VSENETGQPECASAAAVAGLASEVEALRRAQAALLELPGAVSELGGMVAELADELAARVGKAGAGGAPSWLDLPATAPQPQTEDETEGEGEGVEVDLGELARVLLAELAGWVGRVYLRYTDAGPGFPECWLWHPDVVEELLWLMRAWQQAYLGETASVLAVGDWHDRYRPGVVRRVTHTAGTCSLERHTNRDAPESASSAPLASAVERIAAWWGTDGACPAPVATHADLDEAAEYWRRSGGGGRR